MLLEGEPNFILLKDGDDEYVFDVNSVLNETFPTPESFRRIYWSEKTYVPTADIVFLTPSQEPNHAGSVAQVWKPIDGG